MEEMAATKAAEAEIKPGDTLLGFVSQGTKRQHSTGTETTFSSMEESSKALRLTGRVGRSRRGSQDLSHQPRL